MKYLSAVYCMGFTSGAIGFAWLGWQWQTVGHGLNPAIAFPIATIVAILAIAQARWIN